MKKKSTMLMGTMVLGAALFTQGAFAAEATVDATDSTTTVTEAEAATEETATEETATEETATEEAVSPSETVGDAGTQKVIDNDLVTEFAVSYQGMNLPQGGWNIMPGKDQYVILADNSVAVTSHGGWFMFAPESGNSDDK